MAVRVKVGRERGERRGGEGSERAMMRRRTATAIIVEEFISEWSGFEVKKEEAATDSRERRGGQERKRRIAHFINREFPLHIYLSICLSVCPGVAPPPLSPFSFWRRPTRLVRRLSLLRRSPFFLYKTAIALISFNVRRRRRHSDPYALPEKSISCAGGEEGKRGREGEGVKK